MERTSWDSGQTTLRFQLGNDRRGISPLVRILRSLAEQTGICYGTELVRISAALDEAILNAMVHGNLEIDSAIREQGETGYERMIATRSRQSPYCQRRVEIIASISPSSICYRICDEGPGFDPGSVADPTTPANRSKPCGRGILMMRAFMDEVQYNEIGNEVTLVRHRRTEIADPRPRATGFTRRSGSRSLPRA